MTDLQDWGNGGAVVEHTVGIETERDSHGETIERPDWGQEKPAEYQVGLKIPVGAEEFFDDGADDTPSATDNADKMQAVGAMQALWGSNYESRVSDIKALVAAAPPEVGNFILNGRFDNGQAVANSPVVLKWLASLTPYGQQSSQGNDKPEMNLNAEIALIESKIGTKEYIRDEAMQARLRSLYAKRG